MLGTAYAQSLPPELLGNIPAGAMTFSGFVNILIGLIDLAIPIVFAGSLLAVMVGGIMLISKAGGEDKGKTGKQMLLWGVIFLVIAVSIWSVIRVIRVTFGLF